MTAAPVRRAVPDLLAQYVFAALANTEDGHCARVDFLSIEEATAACRVLRHTDGAPPAFVLRSGRYDVSVQPHPARWSACWEFCKLAA